MKIHKYNEMMRYLTRPKDNLSVNEKKKIVKDFYKKAEQPKSKPMPITKYIDTMNRLYGNTKTDEYGNPETATTRKDPRGGSSTPLATYEAEVVSTLSWGVG